MKKKKFTAKETQKRESVVWWRTWVLCVRREESDNFNHRRERRSKNEENKDETVSQWHIVHIIFSFVSLCKSLLPRKEFGMHFSKMVQNYSENVCVYSGLLLLQINRGRVSVWVRAVPHPCIGSHNKQSERKMLSPKSSSELFVSASVIIAFIALLNLCGKCDAELTPPYFNLAEGRKIYASSTCGVDSDGPELYCKLVGSDIETNINGTVINGQVREF